MNDTISTTELKQELNFGLAILVEALPQRYFEQGHIPGAKNIPLETTDQTIRRLIPDLSTPVVTYCTGPECPNSRRLKARLAGLGYTSVRAYEDGKAGWLESGAALISDENE